MTASPDRPWTIPLWRGILLALELCGAGIILWKGVPFYRELLAGNFGRPEPFLKLWMIVAVVLIQAGYWLRYLRWTAPIPRRRVMLGHLLKFLARLNFIFTGGVFSAVFFARYDEVVFSASGTVLLFSILFSMFCVTLDLERIGEALLGTDDSGKPPPSR